MTYHGHGLSTSASGIDTSVGPQAGPVRHARRGSSPQLSAADRAAMARLADGDAEALRDVYARHSAMVFSTAHRIVSDHQLAEECTQDVFLTLWRQAARFDPERALLSTWLFVVTRNRAIQLLRAQQARPIQPHADVTVTETAPSPAELFAKDEEAQEVADALADLPDAQFEVIRLAYFDGLAHREIASRLDLPLGTVKGRIRLALDRLRERLTPERFGAEGGDL